MSNIDIRKEAAEAGVKLWQIADALGMPDFVFSKKLRHELPAEIKADIRRIIAHLKEQEANNEKGNRP